MINWNGMKLKGLNWNGQNLEYWIELWPNIKGVMCNLAFILFVNFVLGNEGKLERLQLVNAYFFFLIKL